MDSTKYLTVNSSLSKLSRANYQRKYNNLNCDNDEII